MSIPFGIERFDSLIGGGAPPGNVVLLAGESGAGAREFMYTSTVMNALWHADDDLFDLYYGDLLSGARPPPEIHYVSFTADTEYLKREMTFTMDEEIVDAAIDEITFRDFSPEYFRLSPVPREWYMGKARNVRDLSAQHERAELLDAIGTYLNTHAAGNLMAIDSVTDLVGAISDEMPWSDIAMLMKGLERAAKSWGGLILLLVNEESLEPTEMGHLMDAAGGTIRFRWESGGSQRGRTMVVEEFRGVLSRIEDENIVQFETEIHDAGFDVSDVRKIR